jgi:hypothetical protein
MPAFLLWCIADLVLLWERLFEHEALAATKGVFYMQVIAAEDAALERQLLNDSDLRSNLCWIANWTGRSGNPQRVFTLRSSPRSKSEWNEIWSSVQLAADISGELGTCFVAIDCREYWLLTIMKHARPLVTVALDRSCELACRQSEIAN